MNITDKEKSFEELKKMCGGYFSDEVLKNFYKTSDVVIYYTCPDCKLIASPENRGRFYLTACLTCKDCKKKRNRQNYEERKKKKI